MLATLKKTSTAALAALALCGATFAVSTPAEARWHGGGWRGGWVGPAVVGGLALGAVAASRPYYGYPAYGYYDSGYSDGCLRRRVVGYTAWGRPIVRAVNVCY